ncbi:MAG: TVP38/TMEM64 family protein [Fretibacterium sp.]|nr:TVP38/TMEM64 family protein [Fretibacterium sp.]
MRRWGKPLAFCILLAALFSLRRWCGWADGLVGVSGGQSIPLSFSAEALLRLREFVASRPVEAASLYIAATAAGCVLLALPGAAFAALAGLLFDPLTGTALCLVAATLGAVLAFLAGRYFLKDAVRPWLERSPLLKKFLFDDVNRSGVVLLMITRLVPLFPYNLQNFAYGLTDIGLWPYTFYTFLFMAPGAAAFTLGAAGLGGVEHRGLYFLIAAVLVIIVTVIGVVLKKRFIE